MVVTNSARHPGAWLCKEKPRAARCKTSRSAPNLLPARLIWPSIWGISDEQNQSATSLAHSLHDHSHKFFVRAAGGTIHICSRRPDEGRRVLSQWPFDDAQE